MNIPRRSHSALLALATLCFALGMEATVRADFASCAETFLPPPQNTNICERLVEELTVNRVVDKVVKNCNKSGLECIAAPHCCVAVSCVTDPACYVLETVSETVQYVYHAGDIYCDFREISAKDLLTKFSRGLYVDPQTGVPLPLTDLSLEPVMIALEGAVNAMECASAPLSAQAKRVLLDLKNGFPGSFDERGVGGGWSNVDLNAVRITDERGWLRDALVGNSIRDALTLGNLVIVNDDDFDQLTSTNPPSAADLVEGRASFEASAAFDLMEHELVHVKQYRELGSRDFSYIYLAQLAEAGYDRSLLEDEAYTFGSEVAHRRGGTYCQHLSAGYAQWEEQRDIALRIDPCAARPSALTWLVSH